MKEADISDLDRHEVASQLFVEIKYKLDRWWFCLHMPPSCMRDGIEAKEGEPTFCYASGTTLAEAARSLGDVLAQIWVGPDSWLRQYQRTWGFSADKVKP